MESAAVFILIVATITSNTVPANTQSIHASQNPSLVGNNVTLYSEVQVTTGVWLFNSAVVVMILPGNPIIVKSWEDKVIFNSSTNLTSLTIISVQVADSGLYTLEAPNLFRAQLTLSVQVPVSNVTLRAMQNNLVEFNDTAVLMCSVANGTSLSYVWLKGTSEVVAGDGVQFSNDGATLTMLNVTRYDEGPFRCNVSNGISQEISPPLHLNISYGPSNTTMMLMPMKNIYRTGSNITLSCSAESSPPAMVQWMLDGAYLNHFSPQLQLEKVTESNSGSYKCIFHNTVTSRFTSASSTIQILEPIESVVVSRTGGPAILNESSTMHCQVNGSFNSIRWWRNGHLIYADNTTAFDTSNATLVLNPVQQSDNGDYRCQAFNPVSNMTSSPYMLEVNYGPMKPVISGPSMALEGTQVVLNCSSDSHPPSHISWYFSGSRIATTAQLKLGPLTLNMSGNYMCMAFNNVTGKNNTAYTMLRVFAPVTMATIKMVGGQPIVNHILNLTCETAGGVESIIWMHGWSPLNANNTRNLSMDNATLTFDPVMHSDDGNYRCAASNPLSNFTSEVFMLDVFYGPEMPTITGPKVGKSGDEIRLSCYASSKPPSVYKWLFNGSVVANTSEYVTPPLTTEMSGMYTCTAYNNVTGKNSTAYTMLSVVEPILDVQVEAPMSPTTEGLFYNLTCNVTGLVDHVYWMKNGEPLHEDNTTHFYMNNKAVTFTPLKRNNTGSYQCVAFNAFWNKTSPPYNLRVNFGPETPVIDGPEYEEIGNIAVFRCSAKSMPPSHYSWWFNGSEVANTSVFATGPLSFNMSGEYRCVAYNSVTGKNSTNSITLTVIAAIESVMIRNNTIPINFENFTLTCDVTGPYDKIYWMKDNVQLNMNTSEAKAEMSYHIGKNTLHFSPVTTYNTGTYQCVATNQAGPHSSPKYLLLVNYGPLSVNISGPDSAGFGFSVTLKCTADSWPDCDFDWFFNNKTSLLQSGSVLTFPALHRNEGKYICKAKNPVTNITMYQSKDFAIDHASALHLPSQGALMCASLFALSVTLLFN